jgi:hypothetical protein
MLAASPIFATNTFFAPRLKSLLAADKLTEATFGGWFGNFQQNADVISSPDQAFDVLDFEPAARKALPPAHFGYLATGVDDDATVRANREGYSRIQIRSRRLVDVEKIDTSVRLLGATWSSPIVICPMGGEKAFHPEGDIAVARAARGKDHLQMLSTVATSSIEDVIAARGGPVWQQLYPTNIWEVGRAIVKRAQAAGSPAIVFTVDLQESSNFETLFRGRQQTRGNVPIAIRLPSRDLPAEERVQPPGASPNTWLESRCLTVSTFRNTKSGFQIWSQTYDRRISDIFAVQDEIAAAVSGALEIRLPGANGSSVPTTARRTNPEAYQAYLQGRYFEGRGESKEDLENALTFANQAITLDARYVPPGCCAR